MNKISSTTKKLGEVYKKWKTNEAQKDKARKEFFDLATEETASQAPASRVVRVFGPTEGEVLGRVISQYPTWILKECDPIDDTDYFSVLIEENPQFQSYSYVNPEDGMVYEKQVVAGAPYLDDDRLKSKDPELYDAVTYEHVERKLRSLEELTPEQLSGLEEFIYEGKPMTKLRAPRKAKQEELEQ